MKKAIVHLLSAVALVSAARAATVSLPYINDFTSSVADFTATSGWSLDAGGGVYSNVYSANNESRSSTVEVPALGGGSDRDFIMSTTFVVNSIVGSTSTIGFRALSETATGGNEFYLADVQFNSNNLRLYRIDPNASLAQEGLGFTLATGTTYNLALEGTYAGNGDLTLSLILDDGGANSKTISATVLDADVLEHQNFGFRNRTNNGGSIDVDYSHLTIVPEPNSSLPCLFALGLLAIRRRR